MKKVKKNAKEFFFTAPMRRGGESKNCVRSFMCPECRLKF